MPVRKVITAAASTGKSTTASGQAKNTRIQ